MPARKRKGTKTEPLRVQGGSPTPEQFRTLQFRIMAQEAIPHTLQIELKSLADVAEFGIKLIDLKLRRQISARDLISLKGILDVIAHSIAPPQGTQVNVTQQVAVDPEQIVTGFLNTLPAELRNAIVAYGRKQTKLEQAAV